MPNIVIINNSIEDYEISNFALAKEEYQPNYNFAVFTALKYFINSLNDIVMY